MHLDDFFKSPYRCYTYIIFVLLPATIWFSNFTTSYWYLFNFNINCDEELFSNAYIHLLFAQLYAGFLFISLIVIMCVYGCCRKNCYQNVDKHSLYFCQFATFAGFDVIWAILMFTFAIRTLSHNELCYSETCSSVGGPLIFLIILNLMGLIALGILYNKVKNECPENGIIDTSSLQENLVYTNTNA